MGFDKVKDLILVALTAIVGAYLGASIKDLNLEVWNLKVRVGILESKGDIK